MLPLRNEAFQFAMLLVAQIAVADSGVSSFEPCNSAQGLLGGTGDKTPEGVISCAKAVEIAKRDAGGLLGKWVDVQVDWLGWTAWYIYARSKSAKPPIFYLIDAHRGTILYKTVNADQATMIGTALFGSIDTEFGVTVAVQAIGEDPSLQHTSLDWYAHKRVTVTGTLRMRPYGVRISGGGPYTVPRLSLEHAKIAHAKK